jgi:hypothetical protein
MSKTLKKLAVLLTLATAFLLMTARSADAAFVITVTDDGGAVAGATVVTPIPGGQTLMFTAISTNYTIHLVTSFANTPGTPALAMLTLGDTSEVKQTTGGTHKIVIDISVTDYTMPPSSPLLLSATANGTLTAGAGGPSSVDETFQAWGGAANGTFEKDVPGTPLLTATGVGLALTPTSFLLMNGGNLTASTLFSRGAGNYSATVEGMLTTHQAGDTVQLQGQASFTPTPVPAPAGLVLVLSGMPVLGLGRLLRRCRKA